MHVMNGATNNISGRSDMRWHVGSLVRVLDTTDFADMAGVEFIVPRGMEAPSHQHEREDEAVFVLRGDVEFTVGGNVVRPAPGEWVYMPKRVAHSYRVLSTDAHLLVMFTPAGIEGFFEVLSEPVEGDAIPAGTLSYDNLFDMEYITELGRQFGLKFLSASSRAAAA